MTERDQPYHLVHIVGGGEHKTPLVASQVFDRAQVQATEKGAGKPLSVSVWVLIPMRVAFEKESNDVIAALKNRCPDVRIVLIAGIDRLDSWPAGRKVTRLRRKMNGQVVYHIRGEMFTRWPLMLRKRYPKDAIVLDMRGFYPLERFINHHHIAEVSDMTDAEKTMYHADLRRLQDAVGNAQAMTTVSEPLRDYLIDHVNAHTETVVIPCCVSATVPDTKRSEVRRKLDIENKVAILYLGGVHKNQYLEELGIPFIKSALAASDKNVAVLITQNKDKMQELIAKFGLDERRVRLISVPQREVAEYLTGMDIGLLLRAPSRQNNFSQPVKFGEYLSAGIPVILEEGTGNMANMLSKYGIGFVVKLSGKSGAAFDTEVTKALDWYEENRDKVRTSTKNFVEECYTWKANMAKERELYQHALIKASQQLSEP